MPRPALAIVVPTRDRPAMLEACLAALRPELGPDDVLLVVDSASEDHRRIAQIAQEADARLIRCARRGASRARNAGWRSTDRELVVFVDDDMRVRPGWADALVAALTPEASFVAGRTLASEDAAGELISVTRSSPQSRMEGQPGQFAPSNNLLIRRSSLQASGGFDERLGPGTWLAAGEDLELIDRVVMAGGHGRFAEGALAVHEQWRDAKGVRKLQYAYGKGMGARFALMVRRDPGRARSQVNELLRLGGLVTLLRRALRRSAPATPVEDGLVHEKDASGILGPVLWRLGALLGLVVGLVVLRPSAVQVPVDDTQAAGLPPAANDA